MLPFYEYKEQFKQALLEHDVVMICVSTGMGKSIGAPDLALQFTGRLSIMVTNPTILSVKALHHFQTQRYKNQEYPWLVGYAAGGEIQYNNYDHIVYTTTGHLNRKIIHRLSRKADWSHERIIDFTDLIMIDEAHLTSTENYVLLYLMHYIYTIQPQLCPKIIISSATLAIDRIHQLFPKAKLLNLDHPKFPMHVHYHPRNYQLFLEMKALTKAAVDQVVQIYNNEQTDNGDILVFCAGSQQVEDVIELLYREKSLIDCTVLRCYASLTSEELAMVTTGSTKRKIIVSTNVAESSITIDGIVHVIDLMLEKIMKTDLSGGTTLSVQLCSRSSTVQRKGRCGRTQVGHYYPLCTKQQLQSLEPHNDSEFDRTDIYPTVLEFLEAGLNAQEILQIDLNRYKEALDQLKQMNMITVDGQVTEIGRYCPQLPIGLRNAYWLYQTKETMCSKTFQLTVILICIFESVANQSLFYVPKRERDESNSQYNERIYLHKQQYFERFRGPCDWSTLLKIYMTMMYEFEQTNHKNKSKNIEQLKSWSRENSMNNRTIQTIRAKIQRLVHTLDLTIDWSTLQIEWSSLLLKCKDTFIQTHPDRVCTQISSRDGVKFQDPKGKRFGVNNRTHFSSVQLGSVKQAVCYNKMQVQTIQSGKTFYLLNYIFDL